MKQAIRLALDLPADRRFGLVATGAAAAAAGSSGDTVVTASMASLAANANYQVRLVPLPCPPPAPPPQQEGVAGAGGGGGSDFVGGGQPGLVLPGGPHGLASQDGTILGEKPARLPRVILTSLGTGRYGKHYPTGFWSSRGGGVGGGERAPPSLLLSRCRQQATSVMLTKVLSMLTSVLSGGVAVSRC